MNNVIACIDGASYTESVCDYAAWAAKRLDSPLEFLHVLIRQDDAKVDASGSIGLGAQESLLQELSDLDERRSIIAREHGRQLLEGAKQRATTAGTQQVSARQRHGELVETLVEIEADTRLYVLGQHDHETKPKHFLLDHNLESAVRALHRPILVANSKFTEPRSFMIAFDGSTTGRKTVEMVADSPLLRGLGCHVVIVSNEDKPLHWASQRLAATGFQIEVKQLEGEPANALAEYAEQRSIDLLVMGAYGHSRIRHLVVGSTTTAILRRSKVPVLILR
ncbi:universal stress protein [Bordetella genomosp. 12]|uniref:Universal stress protein n=1 Tax=Bordetella genomosp. 12 TaxID=463035 RepID=A0A261VCR5_9BORD|nr:universal stress protein [Bordetella genomosp. 12]OZI71370.1 universal stress protein [Bordetella genomosp. 12]